MAADTENKSSGLHKYQNMSTTQNLQTTINFMCVCKNTLNS